MKSEYGPTLGQLLAPRWDAAGRGVQGAVIALCLLVVGGLVGLGLTLEDASYSHGGKVPFSFAYKDLYRVSPPAGAFVKVDGRGEGGALEYSYEVYPLLLPPYTGELTGELPRYASGYISTLAGHEAKFILNGEGKTRVNGVPGDQVRYFTEVEGREMYGRNVLLLPERHGVREGVVIAMLTALGASSQIKAPYEVASAGTLLRPLKTFTFG
jgi:hypothetical protein